MKHKGGPKFGDRATWRDHLKAIAFAVLLALFVGLPLMLGFFGAMVYESEYRAEQGLRAMISDQKN